jgi:DHA1 family bicyclomycin/chloramphenicol resistance-like MFS transporter
MTTVAQRMADRTSGELSRGELVRTIVVLGSLIAIGPFTIDMYLPALPAISADLHAGAAQVQLTLTGTLVGLAVGQVLVGPLSDSLGRRRPLLAGLTLHVLASVLCIFAPNVAVLGALRVLQGLGAAAAGVVANAVVRDLFAGVTAAKVFSRLMLVMGAAPILAPTVGSQMLRLTDWRGVFAVLAVVGVGLIAIGVFGLRETLPPERRRRGGLRETLRTYRQLLRDGTFLGLVLVAGLNLASLFAYVAGSSFVFQDQYGLSQQQFGLVFGAGALGLIAASQLNAKLLERYSVLQTLTAALVIGTIGGLLLVGFAATGIGGMVTVMISMWLVLASAGMALPNAPALALNRYGDSAGTAAALLGAVQFGVGAFTAPLVGVFGPSALSMAAVVAVGMVAALGVLLVTVRPWRAVPVEAPAAA